MIDKYLKKFIILNILMLVVFSGIDFYINRNISKYTVEGRQCLNRELTIFDITYQIKELENNFYKLALFNRAK